MQADEEPNDRKKQCDKTKERDDMTVGDEENGKQS